MQTQYTKGFASAAVSVALLAGCGQAAEAPGQAAAASTHDECELANLDVLDELVPGSRKAAALGYYIRSEDYERVYFVAVPTHSGEVGVWAVNGRPTDPATAFRGMTFAVNDVAEELGPYPSGPASMSDDGASTAYECANGTS
jgi:hypothetical protein